MVTLICESIEHFEKQQKRYMREHDGKKCPHYENALTALRAATNRDAAWTDKRDYDVIPVSPERAMAILDPAHREHYEGIGEVNAACLMGRKAIGIVSQSNPELMSVEAEADE